MLCPEVFLVFRSTLGGPSDPKWPSTSSIRYYSVAILYSLYIVVYPHPPIHPLCFHIKMYRCRCVSARALRMCSTSLRGPTGPLGPATILAVHGIHTCMCSSMSPSVRASRMCSTSLRILSQRLRFNIAVLPELEYRMVIGHRYVLL